MMQLRELMNLRKRDNNVNQIQVFAAILVLFSHAFPIGYGNNYGEILKELTNSKWSLGALAVAAFFIYSGFFITQSYLHDDNAFSYLKKRVLRIYPGLILVFLLTVFVLGFLCTTLDKTDYFSSPETWTYLLNIRLNPMQWNLPGVFEQNAFGNSINGSLWTIPYQMAFYVFVALIGVLGLLKRRGFVLAISIAVLGLNVCDASNFAFTHFMGMNLTDWFYLALYFTSGMLAYVYADYIPIKPSLAMLSILVGVFLFSIGQYELMMALCGTYLLLYFGYSPNIKIPKLGAISDVSYGLYIFGFPVQQTIVYLFGGSMNPFLNFIIALPITLILSLLSWFLVEKPCMQLKNYHFAGFDWINERLKWMHAKRDHIIESISSINWPVFICVFVVAIFVVGFTTGIPSKMVFPGRNDKMIVSGWYQNENEPYAFVRKNSEFKISSGRKASALCIDGFVPDNLQKDVSRVSVFIDDCPYIVDYELAGGGGYAFQFEIDLPIYQYSILPVIHRVRIEFDGEHIPTENEQDVRILSAAIFRVEVLEKDANKS